MSLYCLVYTSVAAQKMTDDHLRALLRKSRAKNAGLNITGMLLYLDPYFIQVLEGEQNAVNQRFDVIKNDPRHYKVSLIYRQPLEARVFTDWTMGFNKINKNDVGHIEGFCDFLEQPTANFFRESPGEIAKLLDMFKRETLF